MPRKSLDPNSLRNEPADDVQARIPNEQDAAVQFAGIIKGMLVGTEYEYAEDTLRGILETVQRTGVVTPGQRNAVSNIADKPYSGTSRDRRRRGY